MNAGVLSNLPTTASFSIEAWIKVSTFTKASQAILTKGNTAWRLQRATTGSLNGITFGTTGLSNVDVGGNKVVTDGAWHHVVGVYNSSNLTKTLYVDGVVDATIIGVTGAMSTNTVNVAIGENLGATGKQWNGGISEVAIYNTALSGQRGLAHYAARNQTVCRSLSTIELNAWHFISGLFDNSTNTLQLYVNGNQECSFTNTQSSYATTSSGLTVGAALTSGIAVQNSYWSGAVADVRGYNQALSPSAIRTNASSSMGNNLNGLGKFPDLPKSVTSGTLRLWLKADSIPTSTSSGALVTLGLIAAVMQELMRDLQRQVRVLLLSIFEMQ